MQKLHITNKNKENKSLLQVQCKALLLHLNIQTCYKTRVLCIFFIIFFKLNSDFLHNEKIKCSSESCVRSVQWQLNGKPWSWGLSSVRTKANAHILVVQCFVHLLEKHKVFLNPVCKACKREHNQKYHLQRYSLPVKTFLPTLRGSAMAY